MYIAKIFPFKVNWWSYEGFLFKIPGPKKQYYILMGRNYKMQMHENW